MKTLFFLGAVGFLFLHFIEIVAHGSSSDYYQKFAKTGEYSHMYERPLRSYDQSSIKTSGRKTFTKTNYAKTGSSYLSSYGTGSYYPSHAGTHTSNLQFAGGCNSQPKPPMNSLLRCNPAVGCNSTCLAGYRFPDGQTKITLQCQEGTWRVQRPGWLGVSVGELTDVIPASCEPICEPMCENNGICYEPNRCNCPENFSGMRCENSRRPCLNYPALPMNAKRTCSTTGCTITCLKGYNFPDGSAITSLKCENGEWIAAKVEWKILPDCQPTCDPPCMNGGICLSLNVCQCPQDYRGPQCQFRADVCSVKNLAFNGAYNCTGDSECFRCSLRCPEGIEFDSPVASEYVCTYSSGVFKPQPIPQCVYPNNMEIIPIGGKKEMFFETTHLNMSQSHLDFASWQNSVLYNSSSSIHEYDRLKNDVNYGSTVFGKHGINEQQLVTIQERLPVPGTCFTWGGMHYKTFDGDTFSATSECAHTLLRDTKDNSFNIIVTNSDGCKHSSIEKCHRVTFIYLQDKEYILTQSSTSAPVLLGPNRKQISIPGQILNLRTSLVGSNVVITLDNLGLNLRWDGQHLVQVQISETLWNRTEGLCGRHDGDKSTDLIGKDGLKKKTIGAFVNSWKANILGDSCSNTPSDTNVCNLATVSKTLSIEAKEFCSKLLTDKRFSPCHSVIDTALFLEACQWDYCACTEEDRSQCACNTMNVYVRECREKGIKEVALIKWRDEQTCPLNCTGGKIYKPCAPNNGIQTTCGETPISINVDTVIEPEDLTLCEEGCYCPLGTVLHDNKCIEPDTCPCKLRGKEFAPGTSIPKECNTCTCESGLWKCTSLECGARCSVVGDPHYQTFDGKRFDFMGQCQYYLIKGDNFSVEGTNVPCAGAISQAMNFPVNLAASLPSCTRAVTIRTTSGNVIVLKQNREVTIDGKDIYRFPQTIGESGDYVRMASSLFVVVELENGLEIWWDGVTRVYIDAPASFRDKTRGLCGTFNSNQKDDFLTPEGDVEQVAVPFANKWKVNELCEDINQKQYNKDHPCEINVHNKQKAEKYCGIIQSETFKKCHWLVDPQPYYEDCLFDMCSCEAKVSDCLCGALAAYGSACSALGAGVEWRNHVPECGISCLNGQIYQFCGNPCTRTCADISTRPNCKSTCVEGCNCPEGEALDDKGECIPIGMCPCQKDGIHFPAGYKEIQLGTLNQELCTCINSLWQCKSASKEEISKYPKATDRQTVCKLNKNQEFTVCEPSTPLTCKNMHEQLTESTSSHCRPGCKCKQGFVLKEAGGAGLCIRPSECPCHHGGRSYKENEVVKNDCNNCTCHQGTWNCTSKICPAVCTTWGDSHYTTFDGKDYDYQGQCDYIFTKGSLGKHDNFEVISQNVLCGTLGVTCAKSLTVKVASESITLTHNKPIPTHQTFHRMTLRQTDLFVIIEIADLGVVITWDKATRISVRVEPRWKGRLKGLCGNYNDDQQDDFQTPSGGFSEASPQLFGDSWRLSPTCPTAASIVAPCEARPERKEWALEQCGLLKSSKFVDCHSEVPVDKFLQRCIFDTCACDKGGDCECLCTALQAYAMECANKGVFIKWRSQELCPLQCDERCTNYSPCVSTCPTETCDNLLSVSRLGHLCSSEPCVEGCAPKSCPEGQVYLNSSTLDCVPRNTCKPVCMEVDGVIYSEGDVMEEDECHRCHCTRTKKVCTGKPCISSTTTTTIIPPNDMTVKCQSGWTEWLNQDKPKNRGEYKKGKKIDIEPIPSAIYLNSLNTNAKCSPEKMIDIQCRTVEGHIDPKATGLDVECSLERGLICKADKVKGMRCPDFEIRVLCQCEKLLNIFEEKDVEECDVSAPNKKHETDCHAFFHCVPQHNSNIWVEKTCGPTMWFNPSSQICDWPDNVLNIRPECKDLEQNLITQQKPLQKPVSIDDDIQNINLTLCPPGYRYSECGTECHRLCSFYTYFVRQRGICSTGSACEAGCISESRQLACPPGWFWRDNATCVQLQDCTCRAHDGSVVRPGTVHQESECEFCQCIDNYYTCDKSACLTTTTLPTLTTVMDKSRILAEHIAPVESSLFPVTVAEKCPEDRYTRLLSNDADWPVSDSAFSASSTLNEAHQPWHARLGAKLPVNSAGSWSPSTNNQDEYLQIDLGRVEPIYGIVLLGSPLYDNYVTSFQLLYSSEPSGKSYQYAKTKSGMPQLFRGCVDQRTPVQLFLDIPVETRFIRFVPKTWHNDISVRLDIIGCSDQSLTTNAPTTTADVDSTSLFTIGSQTEDILCDEPMGVDNGLLSEKNIFVSSEKISKLQSHGLKLNGSTVWQPLTNTPNEWIKFDFEAPRQLTGLKSHGGPNGWVTAYKVQYSHDDKNWNPLVDEFGNEILFPANFDQDTIYTNFFKKPLKAQYLKVLPKKWTNHIQMCVEPLGCFEPYPTIMVEVEEPEVKELKLKCQHCPGIEPPLTEIQSKRCFCEGTKYWDGKNCISRAECPCKIGHLTYPVGTVFEKEDCSECLCALGGVAQCEPKRCEPCEAGLKSTVTTTCGCICKPCPIGEILCPTSNICINQTSWCNGIIECPDDEVNCVSTTPEPQKTTSKPDKVQCPPIVCPPGFKIKLKQPDQDKEPQQNLSPMFHMYGGRKTKMDKSKIAEKYYGAKGRKITTKTGIKTLPRRPIKTSHLPHKQQICAEFVCEPPEHVQKCPEPSCPPGYTVVYPENEEMDTPQIETFDEPLICRRYECHPPPVKDNICNVTGCNFNTFDGTDFKYDICNHIIARDLHSDDWDVSLVKNCSEICTRDLVIRHGSQLVKMFSDLSIEYNGYRYTAEQTNKIGANNLAFVLSRMGDTLLFVSNHYGFWIMWNKQGNVKLAVTEKLLGQVDGLCGFYDNNPKNDKRRPDGRQAKTVVQFGDSWLLSDQPNSACEVHTCPLSLQNAAFKMCQVVKERILAPCLHTVTNIDKWISKCLETTCSCLEQAQNSNQTKSKEEKCRCNVLEEFIVECTTNKPSIELEDWRMQLECPVSCTAPLVHHDCYRRRCEPTCDNLAAPDACPVLPGLCFPGCYCPAGLVRKKDRCVAPRECRDCECNVLPQLEYVTFDGANYTVPWNCTYIMAREKTINNEQRDFEVYVTNAPCRLNPDKMCTNVITLLVEKHHIQIKRGNDLDNDHIIYIDDTVINFVPFDNGWAEITRLPARHVNILISKLQLELRVYYPTLGASLRVPSLVYSKKLEGVCGDCDRNPENDNKMPNGESTTVKQDFVNSWRQELGENCVEEKQKKCEEAKGPDGKDPCLVLLDSDRFGQCHLLLDPSVFLSTCWHDTCSGQPELACSSLETYAMGCRAQGICIDYHTELCPAKTCPSGTHYQLCGPPCIPTCDKPKGCSKGLPREGCFCPIGLVLKNNTCVEERECFVCDDEGHYPGDTWQKDACTNCLCDPVSHSVKCETKNCATVDTVCAEGFQPIKVKKSETECCEKFACVPANTTKKECEEPKPLNCGKDQIRILEKRPDGCHDYVCQCKSIEECPPLTDSSSILPVGMERIIDDSGCCSHEKLVCKSEKCPKPPICSEYYHAEKQPILENDQCCPEYKCLPPPDKCVFTKTYTASDKGGEREVFSLEQEVILVDENATIHNGPCRQCTCEKLSSDSIQMSCTKTECSAISESSYAKEYVLEEVWTHDQCCPTAKRTACKSEESVKKPGEKWPLDLIKDPCTILECAKGETENDDVTLIKHIVTCDKKCKPGTEYREPQSGTGECCGACKQTACVVDDIVHPVGDVWVSADFCTEYQCVNDNETILVSRNQKTCPKPAEDLYKEFVYEYREIPNECCGTHVAVACLVSNNNELQPKPVGATWKDPAGDPCVTWTCIHAGANGNELQAQRTVQTCNTGCRPGWIYAAPGDSSECCGECIQVKCVANGVEYLPGDKWVSADGCTMFECERQNDGTLTVSVNQETCPDITNCPVENLWKDVCCTRCNITSRPMERICEPTNIDLEDTVGLVVQLRQQHGRCKNIKPITGFTECRGHCDSGTHFNQKTSSHDSICSCCQATKYVRIAVELVCVDGHHFEKQVAIPNECECAPCSASESASAVKKNIKS